MPEISEIQGVGPVLAKAFTDCGFSSVEKIAAAKTSELVTVPGVSDIRAKQLLDAARNLLDGKMPLPTTTAGAKSDAEIKAQRVNKKEKKKKKDKKKNKSRKSNKNNNRKKKKNQKNKKRSKGKSSNKK